MASNGGIVEKAVTEVIEDKLYVAVGKEVKESKSILAWALLHADGKKICIIHVHQPAQMTPPLKGGKFGASKLKEQEVRAYRELEMQNMHEILDDFLCICRRDGAQAEKVYIEMDSIEKGIVELISQHRIKQLVIGAATEKHYSRRMMEVKSRKAMYVRLQAPVFCHIWFICKGNLIYTREGNLDGVSMDVMTPSLQASPNNETGRSGSVRLGQNIPLRLADSAQEVICRPKSVNLDLRGKGIMGFSSPDGTEGVSAPHRRLDTEGSYDEWDRTARRTLSQGSGLFTCSSSGVIGGDLVPFEKPEGSKDGYAQPQSKVGLQHSSPHGALGGSIDGEIHDQPEQVVVEAEDLRQEVFEESVKHGKAEKDTIEAIHGVDVLSKLKHLDLESLQDQLRCTDNTPSISWQTRLGILTEISSALSFLHSSERPIVHCDLKPANILLDANPMSKLSDFGMSETELHTTKPNIAKWRKKQVRRK